jgi:hypothetical protein
VVVGGVVGLEFLRTRFIATPLERKDFAGSRPTQVSGQ